MALVTLLASLSNRPFFILVLIKKQFFRLFKWESESYFENKINQRVMIFGGFIVEERKRI